MLRFSSLLRSFRLPSLPSLLGLGVAAASWLPGAASGQVASIRTLNFQQGVDGYESTTQFRMRANGLTENGRDLVQYYLDGSPFANEADDTVDVLRFGEVFGPEPHQVPAGATILDAQLFYSTGDAADAVSGGPYQTGRLLEEVAEGAVYTDYPLEPQARRSVRALTAEPWLAGAASVQALEVIPIDVTDIVQAWSAGAPNHGVVTFANDTTDGWQVCTISHPETARRPKLRVSFLTGAVRLLDVPATGASIVRTHGVVEDGSTRVTATVGNPPNDPIGLLLRFDGLFGTNSLQVGPEERVVGAKLLLQTAGQPAYAASADSASPFTIHQILAPWTAGTDYGTNGATVAEGDLAEATDEVVGMGEWTRATAEVTSIVGKWQAGLANHGIHVKPGGGNGWEVFLTGATNAWKPTLRLWTVPYTGNPTASIAASPRVGETPLTVEFDGSASVDPDGTPLTFAWNFGDGSPESAGAVVRHVFEAAGVYDVSLKVTDSEGRVGEAAVTVRALGAPVVRWTTSRLDGPEPLRVEASAAGSLDPDGGVLRYRWEFGDGTAAEGESVEHAYRRGGTFPLVLTVTDDEGRSVSVTKTARVRETSVETRVFQEGRDGYAGTFERRVQANGFAQMGGAVPEYYLDGRPQTAAQATNDTCELIRFDGLVGTQPWQIPPKSTVIRARLTYHSGTDVNANTDGPYVLGYLTKPVGETTLYADLDAGNGVPEEAGPRGSVEPVLLAGFADIAVQEVVSADLAPFVQRWVNGETNLGVAIFTDDTTDGWQISTIGHPEIARRPRLEVDYTVGEVKVRRFPLVRSALVAKAAETLDGSGLEVSFLDGGADADYKEGLLLFEDVFGPGADRVPAGEQVLAARLVVRTGGLPDSSADADADDPYTVHAMLRPWEVTSQYGTNGVSVVGGDAGPAVGTFLGMGERTWSSVDLLAVVMDWAAGAPNHGLNVKPQGTDGWQIHWGAAADPARLPVIEVVSETARPEVTGVRILQHRITEGGEFALRWSSSAGLRYRVERSEDLRTWVPVGEPVTAAGPETEGTFSRAGWPGSAGFLRVSLPAGATP